VLNRVLAPLLSQREMEALFQRVVAIFDDGIKDLFTDLELSAKVGTVEHGGRNHLPLSRVCE